MKIVKKAFNMEADLVERIEAVLRKNPGATFTLVMDTALRQWLKNPSFEVNRRRATEKDIKKFMHKNRKLMDDLSKGRSSR